MRRLIAAGLALVAGLCARAFGGNPLLASR
jgi:hypothetical protein